MLRKYVWLWSPKVRGVLRGNRAFCTRWKGAIIGNFTLHLFANLLHIIWGVEERLQNGTAVFFLLCDLFLILKFINYTFYLFIFYCITDRSGPPQYRCFMITHRHTTVSRTPLGEWFARHKDLYLKTHSTHKREISIPPSGFELAIPTSERPLSHA
jgi:hypothetical protein